MKIIGLICTSTAFLIVLKVGPLQAQSPNEKIIWAEDGSEKEWFGTSVSIFDDYVIVGAEYDNKSGPRSGAAYIFKKRGDQWTQIQEILPPDASPNGNFGRNVSIVQGFASVYGNGSIYIYKQVNENWEHQLTIEPGYIARFDSSGERIIIGVSGVAYIYKQQNGLWDKEGTLIPQEDIPSNAFGMAVSISGEYAAVGDQRYQALDSSQTVGAVYIFKRNGTTWHQQAKLTPIDSHSTSEFGKSLSICGKYIIISSYHTGEKPRKAYIFELTKSWNQIAELYPDDGKGDNFGISVSMSGKYAVVGDDLDGEMGEGSGAVYVYRYKKETWQKHTKLTASTGVSGDHYGYSVCISSNNLVVGVPWDNLRVNTPNNETSILLGGTKINPNLVFNRGEGSAYIYQID